MREAVASIDTGEAVEALTGPEGSASTLLLVHLGDIKDALVGARSAATFRKKARWLLDMAEGRGLWARLFG